MHRTGIDLSSTRCILVDAEALPRRSGGRAGLLKVYHCASLPIGAGDGVLFISALEQHLASHAYSRRAWVNLWDLRTSHQYLLLPAERGDEFEALARRHGASALGLNDEDVTVSIRVGATRVFDGRSKTEVSYFAADTRDIRRRLAPLIQAGVVIEGVTTPCGALWSQATLRRASPGDSVHAQIALGETQSALAIFSNGSFLYGRDLGWGYTTNGGSSATLDRDALASRLSRELRHSFLYVKQYWEDDVSLAILCGDMPEIRSLVAPLIERLGIEVETLDTLEGIDASSLPEGFAERAATYRIASSIAAGPAPVNVLPAEPVSERPQRTLGILAAAGTAAAVGLSAFLYVQASSARADAERQVAILEREVPYLAPNAPHPGDPGPSVARVLADLVNAIPNDILVKSLRVSADGDFWNVNVKALSARATPVPSSIQGFLRFRTASSGVGGEDTVELSATYRVKK